MGVAIVGNVQHVLQFTRLPRNLVSRWNRRTRSTLLASPTKHVLQNIASSSRLAGLLAQHPTKNVDHVHCDVSNKPKGPVPKEK
jgi:hypothetical protein